MKEVMLVFLSILPQITPNDVIDNVTTENFPERYSADFKSLLPYLSDSVEKI